MGRLRLPRFRKERMGAIKSATCSKGHPMEGENLYWRKNGARECRACMKERAAAKRRAAGIPERRRSA